MLGLKLNHVSKSGLWWHQAIIWTNFNLQSIRLYHQLDYKNFKISVGIKIDINRRKVSEDNNCEMAIIFLMFSSNLETTYHHCFEGKKSPQPLQWRHKLHNGVSNHQRLSCLLNCLFRHRSKKTSRLYITGLCEGNSPVCSIAALIFWGPDKFATI